MSPEPSQEPLEESLKVANLPRNGREATDSDSEDENVDLEGYMPLSQIPTDSDPVLDEDEDSPWSNDGEEPSQDVAASPSTTSHHECSPETLEVWSSPRNQSNIDLNAEKVSQVKSMMASFTLPESAFPEWAHTVSEDQWKEQLMRRIKEMQNRDN